MQRTDINFILREDQNFETPAIEPVKKNRKFILIAIILFFLFISGFVAKAVWPDADFNNPDNYDPITLEPKKPEGLFQRLKYFVFSKEVNLAGQKDDRINILLLGMGGLGHDGPYLTDTIIIASIKPSTKEVALISIPRDLGVYIPNQGWWKINHVNHFGEMEKANWGGAFATEVISNTFNIEIPYYIRIDFEAFREIIDEVDGVTVNVERSFVDYEYPAPNDQYQTVSFTKGEQTLNGVKALQYSRSRHGNNGEGSDFARSRRQQQILLALKDKVFSISTLANPLKIYNIIQSLDRNITTNMEFADIVTFLKMAKEDVDSSKVKNFVLDNGPDGLLVSGTTAQGAYILQPKTGDFNEINAFIQNIFGEQPQKTIAVVEQDTRITEKANIEILNGTWIAGLAAKVQKTLEDAGFNIISIGNTEDRPIAYSGIYNVGESLKSDTSNALKEKLQISIRQPAKELTFSSSTDILIVLGTDYQEQE